jgi:hypothetical protein
MNPFSNIRAKDIERIEKSYQRLEDRVDLYSRDTTGLGQRLDQRIDGVRESIEEMREQNSEEHRRVITALKSIEVELQRRVEDAENQIKDVTVKMAVEIGKFRGAAEGIEERRRIVREFVSGEFITKYKLIVAVVVLLIAIAVGVPLVSAWKNLINSLF